MLNATSTFNLGTSEGWSTNDGLVLLDAGQNGVGDHVVAYTSLAGEGFHELNFSNMDFTGDYDAIGAYAFEFDARFVSGASMNLRVYLLDTTSPTFEGDDFAVSSQVFDLSSADMNWHHYVVSLDPADVMVVQNSYPRTHISLLGIRHDPNGDGPGFNDLVGQTTTVYFDNMVLTAIPEPRAIALVVVGPAATLYRARRRRA